MGNINACTVDIYCNGTVIPGNIPAIVQTSRIYVISTC